MSVRRDQCSETTRYAAHHVESLLASPKIEAVIDLIQLHEDCIILCGILKPLHHPEQGAPIKA